MIDTKLAICAGASLVAHYALALGLEQLPPRGLPAPPERIVVRVIEPAPAPPPEPPKPPEPEPEPPKPPPVATVPHARPVHAATVAPVARDAPPPDHPAVQTSDTTDTPVFGVTMESTSQQGGGPAVAVGNTLKPSAPAGPATTVKPLAQPAPVAAYEATKLPLPQGRCFGTYTDEARAAGTEGTVVLDLTVDERGHARDVIVVQGLDHGLSAAALAAARACQFSPGEKEGKPVAVRIKGFKITFMLQDAR